MLAILTRPRSDSQTRSGFTIVELMIATLIFAVILLVITTGVIHFSSDYYKGVNSSTTQTTTRAIIDTASQAIQFDGADPQTCSAGTLKGAILVGNEEFFYNLNKEVGAAGAPPYFLYEMPASGQCLTASNLTTDINSNNPAGRELLGPHMRLISFSVSDAGSNLWTVSAGVAYGDDDLFCSAAQNNCKNNRLTNFRVQVPDLTCRLQTGLQFCDVSVLTSTVGQRVQ